MSENVTPDFSNAQEFQTYVLGRLAALHERVDDMQARHDAVEQNVGKIADNLSVLHNEFGRFLESTAPWLVKVQDQLERIERKFDTLMTRMDELLDDLLELRARHRDTEPNDWTN